MAYIEDDSYRRWLERSPRAGSTSVAPVVPDSGQPAPLNVVGLTPGYTPNYKQLILNDPSYLSWKNNATLDVQQAAAARRAALQALVTKYGGLGKVSDPYGDIDLTTRDLAAKNQYSDISQLERNYGIGQEAGKKALAARQALHSGETPYMMKELEYQHGANEYDLGQQFANAYQQVVNNYVGAEGAARRAEAAALSQAMGNVYSNPANRPVAGTEATLDPDWYSKYGQPVYTGPDGTRYVIGASGDPELYVPAAPATPPPVEANLPWGPGTSWASAGSYFDWLY